MMTIKAIGHDMVEVARIQAALDRYGDRFRKRLFSAEECSYCDGKGKPAEHYAGRFAAKEAVVKVLGTGFVEGVGIAGGALRDIVVKRAASGRPSIELRGACRDLAERAGIGEILISITHTSGIAGAVALGREKTP